MSTHENLLAGSAAAPAPTLLPDAFPQVRARLAAGEDPAAVAADAPAASLAWAVLAERALGAGNSAGEAAAGGGVGAYIEAYAYARVGYHRGLDALRGAGWRGRGPVPASHVPNQGFLRALLALAEAARLVGETAEHERCTQFLVDSGTSADEVAALAR
ncbi:DUF3151 family protein [Antribacter gilvus]|uniref:DUF3151 family protein n=1 Tax=Antribacter gilvus TaxID=2304675 RepID=UPI000F7B0897|nr:DUF3151 family protein [Antribacter gilvus]